MKKEVLFGKILKEIKVWTGIFAGLWIQLFFFEVLQKLKWPGIASKFCHVQWKQTLWVVILKSMVNLCYMVKMSISYVTSIKYFKTLNSAVAKCNVNNNSTSCRFQWEHRERYWIWRHGREAPWLAKCQSGHSSLRAKRLMPPNAEPITSHGKLPTMNKLSWLDSWNMLLNNIFDS